MSPSISPTMQDRSSSSPRCCAGKVWASHTCRANLKGSARLRVSRPFSGSQCSSPPNRQASGWEPAEKSQSSLVSPQGEHNSQPSFPNPALALGERMSATASAQAASPSSELSCGSLTGTSVGTRNQGLFVILNSRPRVIQSHTRFADEDSPRDMSPQSATLKPVSSSVGNS